MRLPAAPWIVAHRGASGEAPENTLESFALAVAEGADMIELDLQLTPDGSLAVVHDFSLALPGQLPGRELRPEETRYETLLALRPIPRLEEVLAALPPGFPVNIELKRERAARAQLVSAVAAIAGRPNTLVSSFDWPLLIDLRAVAPGLPLAALGDQNARREDLLAISGRLEAWSVHVAAGLAKATLTDLVASGRSVLCYTVNDAAEARRLFATGVSGVFSDFPGRLRASLGLSTAPQFH